MTNTGVTIKQTTANDVGAATGTKTRGQSLTNALVRQLVREQLLTSAGRTEVEPTRRIDELLEQSPEEVDANASRDPDDPNDSDDLPGTPSFRRSADIVFERPASRRAPRLPVGTRVAPRRTNSRLDVRIRSADPSHFIEAADVMGADQYEARLESVAAVLLERQEAAILAPSLAQAFFALQPLTQAELGHAASTVDAPWLSKRNGLLVHCPWGTMPLEFFWWRKPEMADAVLRAIHRLPRVLQQTPGCGDSEAARLALAEIPFGDDRGYRDSVRKLVGAVRAVLANGEIIRGQRSNLPDVDDVRVVQLIQAADPDLDSSRLLTVVRMAIVGAFEQEWL